jgi:hypothetical protein
MIGYEKAQCYGCSQLSPNYVDMIGAGGENSKCRFLLPKSVRQPFLL